MKKIMAFATFLILSGCTHYWVRPGTDLQQTAKDLSECRLRASQGGQRVFTAAQLEYPCMGSKGYGLSYSPPSP